MVWFQENGGRRGPPISPAPSLAPARAEEDHMTQCAGLWRCAGLPVLVAFAFTHGIFPVGMPALCQRDVLGVSKACCCIFPNSRPRSAFPTPTGLLWGCWGTLWLDRWTDHSLFIFHHLLSASALPLCLSCLPTLSYPLSPLLFTWALLRWAWLSEPPQTDVSLWHSRCNLTEHRVLPGSERLLMGCRDIFVSLPFSLAIFGHGTFLWLRSPRTPGFCGSSAAFSELFFQIGLLKISWGILL